MQKGSFAVITLFMTALLCLVDVVAAENPVDKALHELHDQGFKTHLGDFNFSTSAELRAREAILKAAIPNPQAAADREHPELMEPTGNNQAIVVWRQDSLRRTKSPSFLDGSYELKWDEFEEATAEDESEIDAACSAILAGPIQFGLDASRGNDMLLPHLPPLKFLAQTLNDRMIIALHDGNRDAAWTNLLASTRLVTQWNPEPIEVSHRVRFNNAKLVFQATWQAMQTNGWTDDQLARLQKEWEKADFLSRLPEIQAFRRASDLNMLASDEITVDEPESGMDEDKQLLLFFGRDREVEWREAVKASTWMQMRTMPGVTNELFFQSKHQYQHGFQIRLNQRYITGRIGSFGVYLLAQAAETEAERRVLITALAMERYRAKNKRYPDTLLSLEPEFLKSVPADFANGQPFHYRLNENGHFLLYSVGLDCADSGGKIEPPMTPSERSRWMRLPNGWISESDIVWPLAAEAKQVLAFREEQSKAQAERRKEMEAREREEEKRGKETREKAREAAMTKLLAQKPSLGKEPVYEGKPLSLWVMKLGENEFEGPPADAVEAVRAIGPNAVPFLLEWMRHPGAERPVEGYPDSSDVEIAWWALGERGEAAIPVLARIINTPYKRMDGYSAWTESAKAISYLGPKAIVPMLTAATNMQGKHEMWELLHNLGNMGTNGAPAVPALIHWANDPDYFVRSGVMTALGGIGKRPDLAVPALLNALHRDEDSMVRRSAATALGPFANDSAEVLAELAKALKDANWEARGGALSGLGKVLNKPEVVVPLIVPFLYDTNNVLQRSAAYALRDLGSEAGFQALLAATNAPSSWPGIADIIHEVREKSLRQKAK